MPRTQTSRLARVALALGIVLPLGGCIASHDRPLVNVWAVNTGSEDRVIVLGSLPDGASPPSSLLIPADGTTRSTFGSTTSGRPGATAAVLVYDLDCTLIQRVELPVGSFLLTLTETDAVPTELARATEPTGAELAARAPASCPAPAPS